ncbi:MAG: hypothetical protein G3M70_11160 [Candidatus Nitronauta litoralis]|uniref:PLL-like beta propeller domain-containing protein n=1 Tax=Candidatus Nitronauta litoralis TaxID=2705533 RepID=A0A7T0BWZ8_9BACT|nr:MAG: hypothetical protein G3M70_11160 [Candidatus Nitronauta litoralis]
MDKLHDPRFCSCCLPPVSPAPAIHNNRPGLPDISYRLGTFATFRQALLDSISSEPALSALSTRESDDFAITVLELFAAVGDVLTFYNERIANELFLRTSRERDSVLRLTRLIGYRLHPGLAATTLLAFTLDKGAQTRIHQGLKVMSVPGQDEKPQTFETIEKILAHSAINQNPVFAPPMPFNVFAKGQNQGPVLSRPENLTLSDRMVVFGLNTIEEKTVDSLTLSPAGEMLTFSPPIQRKELWHGVARAARLERRLRFFGHNAPGKTNVYIPGTPANPWPKWEQQNVESSFNIINTQYPLDSRYEDIKPGMHMLVDCGAGESPRLRTAVVVELEDKPSKINTSKNGLPQNHTVMEDTVTHLQLRQTIWGKPSVIPHPDLSHSIFARSGTGAAVESLVAIFGFRWAYLGQTHLASSIEGIPSKNLKQRDIFAINKNGKILQRVWNAGPIPNGNGTWKNWIEHHPAPSSSGPETHPDISFSPKPVLLNGDNIQLFSLGPNSNLITANVTSGAPQTFLSLDGNLTSEPSPVSTNGVKMDVFARGADRALWWIHFDGANWGEWESLGGSLATAPVSISFNPFEIEVVALDDAGALIYRKNKSGVWKDWVNLGGNSQDKPALIKVAGNRLYIFTRGADNQLWQIRRKGNTWSEWSSFGGGISSSPSVLRVGNSIHVYARGEDGTLVHIRKTGTHWGNWSSLGNGLGSISNRRNTRIYQISSEDIDFRKFDYPAEINGGRVALRLTEEQQKTLPGELEQLTKGRRIILKSGFNQHVATITTAFPANAIPGQLADHMMVDFFPALPDTFAETEMLGNVAKASHGETHADLRLGHGDASKKFQKFTLPHSPMTYLPNPLAVGGKAELEVRINGELWKETPSLYNRAPTERIYTARQNDDGETELTFGDGIIGSRLPTGPMNVMATFRKGLGLEGKVKADQLSLPLERPVGLRGVTNPFDADGGADPETRDNARNTAPSTVRTFGRVISLQDFEDIATTSGLVSKASVTWVWYELERAVHLTVAGTEGSLLSPESLKSLFTSLDASRDPNRQLFLANFNKVPIVLHAKVLRHPDFEHDAVLESARQKALDLFSFENMLLGKSIHASQMYASLQSVQGAAAVDIDVFHLKDYEDLTPIEMKVRGVSADSLQNHILIFPARPTPSDSNQIDRYAKNGFEGNTPPPVLPAEQAYLEDPENDLIISVVESLDDEL